MSDADKPAFPHPDLKINGFFVENAPGMTYRQWLEGLALQGLLSGIGTHNLTDPDDLTSYAKLFANVLIAKQQEHET